MKNNSIKGDFRQTFANRRWLFFLILAFVGGVAFASMNTYLFPYMEELGISRLMMTDRANHLHRLASCPFSSLPTDCSSVSEPSVYWDWQWP